MSYMDDIVNARAMANAYLGVSKDMRRGTYEQVVDRTEVVLEVMGRGGEDLGANLMMLIVILDELANESVLMDAGTAPETVQAVHAFAIQAQKLTAEVSRASPYYFLAKLAYKKALDLEILALKVAKERKISINGKVPTLKDIELVISPIIEQPEIGKQ